MDNGGSPNIGIRLTAVSKMTKNMFCTLPIFDREEGRSLNQPGNLINPDSTILFEFLPLTTHRESRTSKGIFSCIRWDYYPENAMPVTVLTSS